MNSKSLSRIGNSEIKGATVAGLADFPLGSLQSRAAVRSFLEKSVRKASGEVYPPDWSPKTAAQKAVLESSADILFFGQAAGSLKTETMLVDAARECGNPNLRAIIFRQSFPQMSDIIEKTQRLYGSMGARFVGQPTWTWTFPSGGKIRLAYIANDRDIFDYLGPRYSFIGFDESTLHSEFLQARMFHLRRLHVTLSAAKLGARVGAVHEKPRPGQPPQEANTGLRGGPDGIGLCTNRREDHGTWGLAREDARESARNY